MTIHKKRHILIPSLWVAFLAALIGLFDGNARAESGTAVEAIRIHNLQPAAGKYLNAFYVSGREAQVSGVRGMQLEINGILAGPVRVQIAKDGSVELPAIHVPKRGFMSFSYLYIAITGPKPNPLYLRNANGRPVKDPRMDKKDLDALPDAAFQAEHTGFVDASRLQRLPRREGWTQLNALTDIQQ